MARVTCAFLDNLRTESQEQFECLRGPHLIRVLLLLELSAAIHVSFHTHLFSGHPLVTRAV
jgi:hypothetical protein